MAILRAVVLAAVVAWAGVVHAEGRRRFHDEAGLLVGLGILADYVGVSVLVDLIAPAGPDLVCAEDCGLTGNGPYDYVPPVDIGMRHSGDQAATRPPWSR